ncbi:PKD domain-containing protein, partial [Deinococcus hopiensis]|uniref:PKD domain-containing protein n=1 Tax=Deinococcus hopiensis TaxID=309885 RepID=UPI00111C72D9
MTASLNLSNLLSAYTYTLEWGDGTTETLTPTTPTAQLKHNYSGPGSYTVQVTPQGSTPVTTTVNLSAPLPGLTTTPDNASIRQTVTANLTALVPALTYTLDWGDGTTETITGSPTAQKTHAYAQPGTYTVRLTSPATTPVTASVTAAVPAPTASGTASGLSVSLNLGNLLSGYPYSVAWGDGTTEPLTATAATATLSHAYSQPGTFTVQVTPRGSTPVTTPVTVNAPNSVLTVTPSAPLIRQTVTANLTALVPALTYTLDWGDGTTETITGSTATQKTHTYAQPGTYTVTLSATGTTPATFSLPVGMPVPTVTATSTALTASLGLGNLLADYSYTVNWGDGTTEPLTATAATATLSHAYSQPGTFTVQVTPRGSAPVTTPVTVNAPNSVLTVTPSAPLIRQTVTANLSSLVPALTYTLDWGDGTTETITGSPTAQKTYTYSTPGAYAVSVSAPGTAPATTPVTVGVPGPTATGTASGLTASLGLGNLLGDYSYTVDWGDGTTEPLTATAATTTLSHAYSQPGTFTLQITPQGSTPVTAPISVNAPIPVLVVTPGNALIRQTVTANLTALVPALTYTLDWGDGTTETITGSTATQKTHTYSAPGPYTITLSSPATPAVTAAVSSSAPVPTVAATSAALTASLGLGNLLADYSYTVNWGDGTTEPLTATAATATLSHAYSQPGTFTVQVTPRGSTPVTTPVTVNAPNSVLTVTPSAPLIRQTVTANLSSLVPALTYTLDWGDGTTETFTGTAAQKMHTYAQPGTYTVSLSATGTTPATVSVTAAVPAPTATGTASGLTASLGLGNLLADYSYTVNWGDGTTEPLTATAATATLSHAYSQPGTFTVQVTPRGSTPVTTPVTVNAPNSVLTVTPSAPLIRQTVTANLSSLVPALTYTLDWGDGTTETITGSTATQKTHTYAQPGTYTVTLSATGTTPATFSLPVGMPVPTVTGTSTALTASLGLGNLLGDYSYTVKWGDGTTEPLTPTAATATLSHAYSEPGTYTVQVTPRGSAPVTTPVTVSAPNSVLTVTPSDPSIRQTVTANLRSLVPALTYTLDWGDGTTETITGTPAAQKTHGYSPPGRYTVTLTSPATTPVTASVTAAVPAPTASGTASG